MTDRWYDMKISGSSAAKLGAVLLMGTAGLVGSPGSVLAGSNSVNAKICQKNGWKTVVRADQSTFVNQGSCVSYAAQGGVLTAPVVKGASQLLCESFGGTYAVGSAPVLWTCALGSNSTFAIGDALFNACAADGGSVLSVNPSEDVCSA